MDSLINFVVSHPFVCWAVVFCVLASGKLFGRGGRRRRLVKDLHDSQNKAFKSGFRWREISLKAIPKLDRAFYQKASAKLEALGFRSIGDFEYIHLTEAHPNMRTAIRQFVSDHGQIYAGVYHLYVRGWMGWMSLLVNGTRQFRTIDFETALSDDRFVISTNGNNMPELSCPIQIVKHAYPADIDVADLLERHIANVKRAISSSRSATPIIITTLDEMMERQERQQEIGRKHRDKVGLFSDEELQHLQPNLSMRERQALVAEAQRVTHS